jgi:hypothetical protein
MKFALLIYQPPSDFAARSGPAEVKRAYWEGWAAFGAALKEAGALASGTGLAVPATATTVRAKEGKRLVQEGPYADTKEQFGGFFIIDVPSLDAALEWAARCPALPHGAVEVRPLIAVGST